MKNGILVATDASPASSRAIAVAADLAAKYDTTLHILHVIRQMQLPPELKKMAEVEKIIGERQDVLEFVAGKILNDAERRAKKKGVFKIRKSISQGDPATAVLNYARRQSVDLIVIGTRGLGKVKGMLMGSVSRKVANLAEVNCLIVR